MSFSIHLTVRTLVADILANENRTITITKEIDSKIPVCVIGNQLLLTHVLRTLIGEALQRMIRGNIIVRIEQHKLERDRVSLAFIVGYQGACFSSCQERSGKGEANGIVERVKNLVNKNGGSFEEFGVPGFQKEFRFFLNYKLEQQAALEAAANENRLSGLMKMLSIGKIKNVLN